MFSLMGNCISCIKQRRQPKRSIKLAILGLDSAGKTTTTKALIGDALETAPTIGFCREEFDFANYEIVLYDLGGGKKIRDIWKNYLAEIYGIIYVVDSSAKERIPEVRENLANLLSHEKVQEKPLLVLANKEDLPNHMDEVDVMQGLNLEELVNTNKCVSKLTLCSAIKGTGKKMDANIKDGVGWMCGVLDQIFDKLDERVKKDVAIMEEEQKKEKEARKERVRKAREEREKKEEEERKRLGIEKEEEEEDDDIVMGDPFRKLTANELQKKEEKYRKAREREKEKKRRLKELEEHDQSNHANDTESFSPGKTNLAHDMDDENDLRAPRSGRKLYSLGLLNGGLNKPVLGTRLGSDEEDSESYSPVQRSGRQLLPPLQSQIGTKTLGNSPRPGGNKEKKKNKKNKQKPVETITEIDSDRNGHISSIVDESKEPSSLSYSKIQVVAQQDDSDDTEYSDTGRGGRNMYIKDIYPDNTSDKKKGKKKSRLFSNEDAEGFDTLRLSQHLEEETLNSFRDDNKPPMSPVRDSQRSDDTNTVRKLKKKKKKPPLRKNKLAPSDDEFELSDVQTSPNKQPLPWVRSPSPKKMLENIDSHTNWAMADELSATNDDIAPIRRSRPNFDNDEIML